jgi:ABC-type branched-subunit amino acid transport system substrate-binding protein
LLVVGGLWFGANAAAQDGLTEPQARGKQLYTTGVPADGREVIAVLGEGGTQVPASALPCVGCHGRRGSGNAEGGLAPSNVQWEILTRSYGGTGSAGREYPPYAESSFKRAVGMGLDSGGTPLHSAMPRYRLTQEEASDLVAYLKVISSELDPGVSARALKVGVVLPPESSLDDMAEGVRSVLERRFDQLNKEGGLYGRAIELSFVRPPVEGWRRRSKVASFVEDESIFALLGVFMAGADAELAALSSAEGVPSIGPFSLRPQIDRPLNPWVFYLWPGLEQQARALVQYTTNFDARATETRLVVLYSADESLASIRQAIEQQVTALGEGSWTEVDWVAFSDQAPLDLAALASTPSSDDLLFVGSESQTASLLQAIATGNWRPRIFLLGPLAGEAPLKAPLALSNRLFVAQPSIPSDYSPAALDLYRQLRGDDQAGAVGDATGNEELAALAAAEVLIEGLRRAGKAVSRQSLIEALETLYQFRTGFAPPLSYSANSRVGASGAYLMRPEPGTGRYAGLGGWVAVE